MASRLEVVDEEYIGELKDKSENESPKNSMDWCRWTFSNSVRMKETCKQI